MKIWLRPVSVARNVGLSAHQIAEIVRMVVDRQALLLEAWDGFFNTKG
ncbi:DUF4160 domain-containing protein [Magnetospirillum sp. LM-5]